MSDINPFVFNEVHPTWDIGDFNSDKAYEMGVSAGWDAGKRQLLDELLAEMPGPDPGQEYAYAQGRNRILKEVRAIIEKKREGL